MRNPGTLLEFSDPRVPQFPQYSGISKFDPELRNFGIRELSGAELGNLGTQAAEEFPNSREQCRRNSAPELGNPGTRERGPSVGMLMPPCARQQRGQSNSSGATCRKSACDTRKPLGAALAPAVVAWLAATLACAASAAQPHTQPPGESPASLRAAVGLGPALACRRAAAAWLSV